MKILIKNGFFFREQNHCFEKKDLLIVKGKIAKISDHIVDKTAHPIDLFSSYTRIIPGLIDLHCHLREPGQTEKESIKSGTKAAAKGGYTRVLAMANTCPPVSTEKIWNETQAKIKTDAVISVTQAGTITQDLQGRELSEVFKENKAHVYSDDGKGIQNQEIMEQAIRLAKKNKSFLILHEEDNELNLQNNESKMVQRDLKLSEQNHYPLHFTHLSTQQSVIELKKAKENGIPYSADTTPHHLFFSTYDQMEGDTHFKVNPPLASLQDRNELIKAICDGYIQCIGTDHAPHTKKEKALPYEKAPCGIAGFETAFAACYTTLVKNSHLYKKRILRLSQLIPLFTSNPAKLLGVFDEEGSIEIGKKANLTIINIRQDKRVVEEEILSQGKNTPFIGKLLNGWPIMTIFEGDIVYQDEESIKRLHRNQ